MREIIQCEQGSPKWKKARLGVATASQFHKIITKKGDPSEQAISYMYRLIAEIRLGEPMEDDISDFYWVKRGVRLEPEAAQQFERDNKVLLEPVGFIVSEDFGKRVGCSPDRLIVGRNEAVEIKCPSPWNHLRYLVEGPGKDYRAQVHGQLLIGEFDAVHFYSYYPGLPSACWITERDSAANKYIKEMVPVLVGFLAQMDKRMERCRKLGVFDIDEDYPRPDAASHTAGPTTPSA